MKPNILTKREMQVLEGILNEKPSGDIAKELWISKRTVESHRRNIMLKTKSRTLVGLTKFAIQNNFVSGFKYSTTEEPVQQF